MENGEKWRRILEGQRVQGSGERGDDHIKIVA